MADPSIAPLVPNETEVLRFRFSSRLGLLFRCGPSAILRCIMSVRINPINTGAWWSFAHIFEKVGKRITPAITDSNATATPEFKPWMFWIKAAGFHPLPSAVLHCGVANWRLPVSFEFLARKLALIAAAGGGFALAQFWAPDPFNGAANAPAPPERIDAAHPMRLVQYGPATELLDSQIYQSPQHNGKLYQISLRRSS